jgi:hypothetical protein
MGAIATVTRRRNLFRGVLIASASILASFPRIHFTIFASLDSACNDTSRRQRSVDPSEGFTPVAFAAVGTAI